jgi:hypothetical protein
MARGRIAKGIASGVRGCASGCPKQKTAVDRVPVEVATSDRARRRVRLVSSLAAY